MTIIKKSPRITLQTHYRGNYVIETVISSALYRKQSKISKSTKSMNEISLEPQKQQNKKK